MKNDEVKTIHFDKKGKGSSKSSTGKIVRWSVIAVIAIIVIAASCVIVPAGHTGVVMTLGKVSDTSYSEGFHLKIPFIQTVEIMSNKIQVYSADAAAVSKDLQTVSSQIAVNYRVLGDNSAGIYKNIGREYQEILLKPTIQESMKSVTAMYTAEELITKRAKVGEEIKGTLEEKVEAYGIYIEKFNIVNFDFSAEFNSAIEAKQVAEQNLIKTRTEQEQAIVIANAEAEKKVIAATAEAEAILARANAQAEANEKLNKSLSEIVINYEIISKWDGVLPKVTSDASPIFDIGQLTTDDTTAAGQ